MSRDWQDELRNPLQRLAALPEMMGWQGEWNVNNEYYTNNVVTDPITTGTYIYTGFSAAISGGLPPSQVIGPSIWTGIGGTAAAGVQSLAEGTGIKIDGSDTFPTVSNTGVITVTAEGGLEDIGTPQFPVLVLDGAVTQVQGGLGISADSSATPTISNTGLLAILPGAGISVTGQNELTIANTGVLAIGATPGTALTVTAGQNPTVASTGASSITPGLGIGLEPGRPSNEPKLINTGVVSIVPRNIKVTGGFPGGGDKQLIMTNPIKTLVYAAQPLVMVPPTLPFRNSDGIIAVTQSPGTFWENVMQNGPPSYANVAGTTFQMSFALKFTGTQSASGVDMYMYLQDNTGPTLIEIGPYSARAGVLALPERVPNRIYLFATTIVQVEIARSKGFRKLTGIRFIQFTPPTTPGSVIRLSSAGPCWATWFNQTVPFPT
jgi:hypothetical protein